ncbi:hybrid sensor histidine kinase/response regulator [Iodidimonas muriae]|uniref:histidine kinase n=1 Tax=Iodidimonas muriae TaxID=261467 RepID=A0ABQ2LFK8_9PROT|nr:ATP-binding protein [Iodidimonas muriae]GER08633.1 hybrid sensor histidine kinase/response regulator [Kordiimonadales bacterium JCM 17843]GGO15738.1 hybrid sensor histidine kinase/response regulator [Iodidimonas muriae]
MAKGTIKDGARAMPFTDMADPYETGQRPILIISIAAFTLSLACVLLFGAQGDWSKGLTIGATVLFAAGGGILILLRGLRRTQSLPDLDQLSELIGALPQPAALGDAHGDLVVANVAYRAMFGALGPEEAMNKAADDGSYICDIAGTMCCGYRLWSFADQTPDRNKDIDLTVGSIGQGLSEIEIGCARADASGKVIYINEQLALWLGVADASEIPLLTARLLIDPKRAELKTGGGGTLLKKVFSEGDFPPDAPSSNETPSGRVVLVHRPGVATGAAAEADTSLLKSLFDAAPVGLAIVDGDGRLSEFNKSFKRFAPNRMPRRGDMLIDYLAADDRESLKSDIAQTVHQAVVASPREVAFNTQPPRTGQVFISPLDRVEGRAALVHLIDTTQQKSLERQFVQAQKMQAVGQLAGGVAHDFNNLLTAIIGFCDLLLVRHGPGDHSFSDIMQIKQNANRASNLVRQLLAFSRQQTMRPKVLMITDVLADLSNLLRRLIGETVQLNMIHGRDVGAVRVDQGQFEQVIMNLAVNARDAMEGGGTLTIRTKAVGPDDTLVQNYSVMPLGHYVLIEVSDNGHGIPPDIVNKIFEPFFSTKDVGKGTGLGLSTVYGIIKQTGGFIFVDSTEGDGSTFRVYLPVHNHVPEETQPQAPAAARDLTGKGTILLVEDEDAVRMFASRALGNKGYTVLQAASGEEGLAIVREEVGNIDLLISDVVMPNMDGPTLVSKARELRADLRVVFISGYAEDVFRKGVGEGSDDFLFLPKPFSLKQLAETVKTALS